MSFNITSSRLSSYVYTHSITSLSINEAIVYNKWHETELERWLGDHNVPYPTPADRKDLENLVKSNWESKTSSPYMDWEPSQLQSYIKSLGKEVKKGTESNKESLVSEVKGYWSGAADSTTKSFDNLKDWIFDRSSPFLT